MTPDPNFPEFKSKAVQPIECLKQGWELIKDQYWLFVGMSVVAALMGNLVPLGILEGPMMCGLYLALLKQYRREPVEFSTLFKGFDFFVNGMIAGILHSIPRYVVAVPIWIAYAGYYVTLITQAGNRGDPTAALGFLAVMGIYLPIMFVLLIIIAIGFAFAFPLIADRGLSGGDAVKLSFKAGMANFWGLFGLLLLNGLLVFAGALFCYVGAVFVLPITFAALFVAYVQVFGAGPGGSRSAPPPPPVFN